MASEEKVKAFLAEVETLYRSRNDKIRKFREFDANEHVPPIWPSVESDHKPLPLGIVHEITNAIVGLLAFNRPRYLGQKGSVTGWLNAWFDYCDDLDPFWAVVVRAVIGYGRGVLCVGSNKAWLEAVAKAEPEFQHDAKLQAGAPFFCRYVDALSYYPMPDEWRPRQVAVRTFRSKLSLEREFGEETVAHAWRHGMLSPGQPDQVGTGQIEYVEFLDVDDTEEHESGTVSYFIDGVKVDQRAGLLRYFAAPGWLTDRMEPERHSVGLFDGLYHTLSAHQEILETTMVMIHKLMPKLVRTMGEQEVDEPTESESTKKTEEIRMADLLTIPPGSRMEVLQPSGVPWLVQFATALDTHVRSSTKETELVAGAAANALDFSYRREMAQAKFKQPLKHLQALATRLGRYVLDLAETEHAGERLPIATEHSDEPIELRVADIRGYRGVRADIRTSMPNNAMALGEFYAKWYGKATTLDQILPHFGDMTVEQFREKQLEDALDDTYLRQIAQRLIMEDLLGQTPEAPEGENLGPVEGLPSRGGAAGQQMAQLAEALSGGAV